MENANTLDKERIGCIREHKDELSNNPVTTPKNVCVYEPYTKQIDNFISDLLDFGWEFPLILNDFEPVKKNGALNIGLISMDDNVLPEGNGVNIAIRKDSVSVTLTEGAYEEIPLIPEVPSVVTDYLSDIPLEDIVTESVRIIIELYKNYKQKQGVDMDAEIEED